MLTSDCWLQSSRHSRNSRARESNGERVSLPGRLNELLADGEQGVSGGIGWIHGRIQNFFETPDPTGHQARLTCAVDVPSMGGDEGEFFWRDWGDFCRVEIDFASRFPVADFVDGNDAFDLSQQAGLFEELAGVFGASVGQCEDGDFVFAEELKGGGDVGMGGEFRESGERVVDAVFIDGDVFGGEHAFEGRAGDFGKGSIGVAGIECEAVAKQSCEEEFQCLVGKT